MAKIYYVTHTSKDGKVFIEKFFNDSNLAEYYFAAGELTDTMKSRAIYASDVSDETSVFEQNPFEEISA